MTPILTWKRAVRSRMGSRQWRTRCGRYLVHASEHCWGVDLRPVVYSAWAQERSPDLDRWVLLWKRLSRHRSKAAAIAACEKHARRSARKGVAS